MFFKEGIVLRKLVVNLEKNLDRIMKDIQTESRQRFDHYRSTTDIEMSNIMQTVRAHLTILFQAMRGKKIDEEGLDATLTALGERRARQGYTLTDVLGSFQVAREILYRYVKEALAADTTIRASHLLEFDTILCRLFNRIEFGAIGPFLQFQDQIIQVQQSFLKHKFSNLFKLVEAISNNLNMQEFCEILLDYLCRFYDVKVAGVFLLDEKGRELYPQHVVGLSRRFQSEQRLSSQLTAVKQCLTEGAAVTVIDAPFLDDELTAAVPKTEPDDERPDRPKNAKGQTGQTARSERPECSSLYAPMIGRQSTYGVVTVHSYKMRRFSQMEVQQLETLARIVAVALENARFYQNLLEEKGKLDAIVNSISDGLILIDFHEEIVFINEQATRYLQQPSYKLLGASASIIPERFLLNAKDPHVIQSTYLRALTNIIDHPVLEFTLYKPEIADIRLTMFPVRDRDHHFIGRGLIIEDVSHEKEVNRMKSEFVAIASHTMRTPMTSILGFASLLLEKKVPDQARDKYLMNIHRESMRLTNILNDMLDLANIEAGKISLKLVPVDARELIQSVAHDVKQQFQREVTIVGNSTKLPRLIADRQKLHQAVLNLIANAVKYTQGPITLCAKKIASQRFRTGWNCSQVNVDSPGYFPALSICVEDKGEGIPSDHLNAIFEPFYRLNTQLHEGTGLGLTIVRYIVEAHGGKVWVESKPGKGCAFTFVIPLELTRPDQNIRRLTV
jgi:signal transduction histidine kinase